jgi:hypothetical protein
MPADLWYMVYKDDEGQSHTVKGPTDGIRRAFREGLLGDAGNIRASRTKAGPFQPLRSFPEFRDLVVAPAPLLPQMPRQTPTNRPTPTPNTPLRTPGTPGGDADAVDLGGLPVGGRDASSRSMARRGPAGPPSGRLSGSSGPISGRTPASSARMPVPAPPPATASASGRLPHIQLPTQPRRGPGPALFAAIILLGLAAAFATFFLLQHRR